MKKILAMLLAVMMLLSVASVAMAEGDTATIKKNYTLENSDTGSVAPATTFGFEIVAVEIKDGPQGKTVADMPALTATDVSFTTAEEKNIPITIDATAFPGAGVYTYKITEKIPADANKILGVDYDATTKYLKITIVNGTNGLELGGSILVNAAGETAGKEDSFVNTYKAGMLTVSKTVDGNGSSQNDVFSFTVTFDKGEAAEQWTNAISTTEAVTKGEGNSYTFTLKHGESVEFKNIPYGVKYTVTEAAAEGYTCDKTDGKVEGTIGAENIKATAAYKNTKTIAIDTGVMLDSMPYVLVLAVVGAAVIALIAKKRRVED
jgi:hypothetical protein